MKKQKATMIFEGNYKVIFDDQKKQNPYSVISVSWDKKRKKIAEFAYLDEAMQFLTNMVKMRRIGNYECVGHIPAVVYGDKKVFTDVL